MLSPHNMKSIRKSAIARYSVTALLVAVLTALPVASPATSASSSGVNLGVAYQCSYFLFPDAQLVSKDAGSFSVSVTAGVGCGWTASSNDSWITITSGSSGSGNGTVNYDVSANTGGLRIGSMTIAGISFTVYQSDVNPNCDFMAPQPSSRSVNVGGGSFSVTLNGATQTNCTWSASSNVGWVTITSGGSGTGNGTVNYTVAANGTGVVRVAEITFSGYGDSVIHRITQKG